jgi:hypothetical protein
VAGFLIFLIIPIEFLNTIATISFTRLPDNTELPLRTYTAVYLVRKAYVMPVLRLKLQ